MFLSLPVKTGNKIKLPSEIKDFGQVLRKQYNLGLNISRNGSPPIELMNMLMKTKFNLIRGYSGSPEAALAAKRKEVDVFATNANSIQSFGEHGYRVILQMNYPRSLEYPDVPSIVEFASTAEAKAIYNLFSLRYRINYTLLMPGSVTKSELNTQRTLFSKIVNDPEYKNEILRSRLENTPDTYDIIEKTLVEFSKYNDRIEELMKETKVR